MGSYDGILRVRKWELDEQRRTLNTLHTQLEHIDQRIQAIADQMANSTEGVDAEFAVFGLGAYLEGARIQQQDLLREREKCSQELEKQQLLVSNAFQDLKTIEIAAEREKEREAKRLREHEQKELDEIGIQRIISGNQTDSEE